MRIPGSNSDGDYDNTATATDDSLAQPGRSSRRDAECDSSARPRTHTQLDVPQSDRRRLRLPDVVASSAGFRPPSGVVALRGEYALCCGLDGTALKRAVDDIEL